MNNRLRLGVNIDHVATIRNARGGQHPDPVRAAIVASAAGADGITCHLREDRRHIVDDDIKRLQAEIDLPLNFEMAATAEMLDIVLQAKPHAACIVPEKRQERTTEGGLDVIVGYSHLQKYVDALATANIRVSLFVDPLKQQLDAARNLGVPVVEIHTGAYCDATGQAQRREHRLIGEAVGYGARIGLEVHAGHGLCFETVGPIAAMPEIAELNIGHFLIGEAVFGGLEDSVSMMRRLMDAARSATGDRG